MLIDTYTAWAVRKIGEPFGFVRNRTLVPEIYLTTEANAKSYANIGYEAIEVVVDIRIKEKD